MGTADSLFTAPARRCRAAIPKAATGEVLRAELAGSLVVHAGRPHVEALPAAIPWPVVFAAGLQKPADHQALPDTSNCPFHWSLMAPDEPASYVELQDLLLSKGRPWLDRRALRCHPQLHAGAVRWEALALPLSRDFGIWPSSFAPALHPRDPTRGSAQRFPGGSQQSVLRREPLAISLVGSMEPEG